MYTLHVQRTTCVIQVYILYIYAIVGNIPHAIAFGMRHVVCKGTSDHHDICFLSCCVFSQNQRKLQFSIFNGQK